MAGGGGTSPQPRNVRPAGKLSDIPIGNIIGMSAALVVAVVLIVVIWSAVANGDDAPTSTQQQGLPPMPRTLSASYEEYRRVSTLYESWGPQYSFNNHFNQWAFHANFNRLNSFSMGTIHFDRVERTDLWQVRQ